MDRVSYVDETFLLALDEDIAESHTNISFGNYPINSDPAFTAAPQAKGGQNFFLREGKQFSSADQLQKALQNMNAPPPYLTVQMSSPSAYTEVKQFLYPPSLRIQMNDETWLVNALLKNDCAHSFVLTFYVDE